MDRKLVVTAVLLAAAATAWAAMGTLVASFPNTSTSNHYGLAADANYLYSFRYASPYYIYVLNKSNGSVVGSYPNPFGSTAPNFYCRGLSYEPNGYLWIINYSTRVAGKMLASNGSLVSSWTWPSGSRYGICVKSNGTPSGVTGLYTNYYSGTVWYTTTAGSLISSFTTGYTYNYDLAYDYVNNYI